MTRQFYQRGYVSEPVRTQRGTKFVIRYRVRTGKGKWKHRSETHYGLTGKKAARAVLAQRLREASARKIEAAELTLRDFVETYWKPYLDRKNVKPSTRFSYWSALEGHILPTLGDLLLADIAPLHIEDLLVGKLKSGLSPKTVRNLVGLLQGIFSLAVDDDLIARSPVRDKHKPTVRRCEKPVWFPAQLIAIVEAVPKSYRTFFICATLTGARLGELLGLQWKHVDLAGWKLRIEQSLWRGQLVAPKTPSSVATIPIGDVLAEALTEHLRNSKYTGTDDFVFSKPDGSPLDPDVLRKDVLYPTLDRLNIPRTLRSAGFHTFRHSAASILNQQTGNLKLAQKFLRHSNLSTTADIYTHTSEEAEREAALALEHAIYGNLFATVRKTRNKSSSPAVN